MNMKKYIVMLLSSFLLIGTGVITAQKNNANVETVAPRKRCYKDANKNNVCDNYEKKTCKSANNHPNNKKSKAEGLCDGSGQNKPAKQTNRSTK